MNSRTAALVLTILGAGLLFFLASGEAASVPGLMAGLIAIAAIWLALGRIRFVLASISALLWLTALVLAVFGNASMWMAVFADMGASLLVVLNGLRLLKTGEGK